MRTKRTHRVICEALESRRLLSSTPDPVINFYNTNITVDHLSPTEDQALNNEGSTAIEWMENIPLHVTAIAAGGQSGTCLNDTTDPDNAEIKAEYQWNFDSTGVDSTGEYETLTGFNAAHIYTTPGIYYLTLTVTNEDGYSSGPKTVEVDIAVGSDPTTTHVFYVADVTGTGHEGTIGDPYSLADLEGRLGSGSSDPIPSDSQILFHDGDTFVTNDGFSTLDITQSDVYIGSYSDSSNTTQPLFEKQDTNGGTDGTGTIFHTEGTNIVINNLAFQNEYGSTDPSDHQYATMNPIEPNGINLSMQNCTFMDLGKGSTAVDAQVAADGLYLQCNKVVDVSGDADNNYIDYFLWDGTTSDVVIIGSDVAVDSNGTEGLIRIEPQGDDAYALPPGHESGDVDDGIPNIQRVLILQNTFSNEDGTTLRKIQRGRESLIDKMVIIKVA